MPIGKAIDFKIDGKELKVVGYYSSNDGLDEYLVNANTYKYNIIIKNPHMLIAADDKTSLILDKNEALIIKNISIKLIAKSTPAKIKASIILFST